MKIVVVLEESLTLLRRPGKEMCFRGLAPANTEVVVARLHVS